MSKLVGEGSISYFTWEKDMLGTTHFKSLGVQVVKHKKKVIIPAIKNISLAFNLEICGT